MTTETRSILNTWPDIPCDASGEAEAHDPGCDCHICTDRAEAQQDDYTEARIHDDN